MTGGKRHPSCTSYKCGCGFRAKDVIRLPYFAYETYFLSDIRYDADYKPRKLVLLKKAAKERRKYARTRWLESVKEVYFPN